MEKSAKSLFDLSCNWYSFNPDVQGKTSSSWSGSVIMFEDGGIVGVATDEGKSKHTHVLVGVIVPEHGISVVKINKEKPNFDPVYFDVFKNMNGSKSKFYGDFSTSTFGGIIPLGHTSITLKQQPLKENEINKLISLFETYCEKIISLPSLSNSVLNSALSQNNVDLSQKITFISEATCFDSLPEVLQNESAPKFEDN